MHEKHNLDLYEEALPIVQDRIVTDAAKELLRALLDGQLIATGMCKWKFSNRADLYQRPTRRVIPRDEWRLPNRLAGTSVFDLERRSPPRHRLYCGDGNWLNGFPGDFGDIVQSIQVQKTDIDSLWKADRSTVAVAATAKAERLTTEWLKTEMAANPNGPTEGRSKVNYLDDATAKFSVGKTAFIRAWSDATRDFPSWRRPGAKKKIQK